MNGGAVHAAAESGIYAASTTYTILTATGGVSGAYAGAIRIFRLPTPSLGYDANNVYLTLNHGGFARARTTANQVAVGAVLDQAMPGRPATSTP